MAKKVNIDRKARLDRLMVEGMKKDIKGAKRTLVVCIVLTLITFLAALARFSEATSAYEAVSAMGPVDDVTSTQLAMAIFGLVLSGILFAWFSAARIWSNRNPVMAFQLSAIFYAIIKVIDLAMAPYLIFSVWNVLAVAIVIFLWSGYKSAKRYQEKQIDMESESTQPASSELTTPEALAT